MAQEGNLANALKNFVDILVACADKVGMPLCPKVSGNRRINRPFFDNECRRLKREWRKAARMHGWHSTETKVLERHYHSVVRSRKRAWLLHQLQNCIHLFHSCPRQFWKSFRGGILGLPVPLLSHDAWQDFLQHMTNSDPLSLRLSPSQLSTSAYPWADCNAMHLNQPFTIVEVEAGLTSLHTGKSNGFLGFPSELLRFAQLPLEPGGSHNPHVLALYY